MRKTMLVGLGLALSLAGVAAAQQPEQGQRRERTGDERGFRGRGGPDGLLLKGIALTDAQKSQIAQLRKTQRDQMDARKDQFQKDREAFRAARQKGDTVALRQMSEKRRAAMQQERQQHIAAIRNILTPDQRSQFDKNVTEVQQRMAQRDARGGDRGPSSRGGRGFRGQRGAKGQGGQG